MKNLPKKEPTIKKKSRIKSMVNNLLTFMFSYFIMNTYKLFRSCALYRSYEVELREQNV